MLPAEIPYVCQGAVAAWLAEARNPAGGEREREELLASSYFSLFPWWLAVRRPPSRLSHWHGAACSAVINNWAPSTPQRGANALAFPAAALDARLRQAGWPREAVCYVTRLPGYGCTKLAFARFQRSLPIRGSCRACFVFSQNGSGGLHSLLVIFF